MTESRDEVMVALVKLAGKRRVTDAFCAMIVGTLLGADSNWQEQLERYLGPGKRSTQPSAINSPSRRKCERFC